MNPSSYFEIITLDTIGITNNNDITLDITNYSDITLDITNNSDITLDITNNSNITLDITITDIIFGITNFNITLGITYNFLPMILTILRLKIFSDQLQTSASSASGSLCSSSSLLQSTLNSIVTCSSTWQMTISIPKCSVLSISSNSKTCVPSIDII